MATITRSDFKYACLRLVDKAQAGGYNGLLEPIHSKWCWNEHQSVTNLGYLYRTTVLSHNFPDNGNQPLDDEWTTDLTEEPESDIAVSETTLSGDILYCQQYIVYSATFQVPCFYFTIHDANGTPLFLDSLVKTTLFRLHAFPRAELTSFALSLPDLPFPVLSQGDHPVLGTPSWYLHPCETAAAVEAIAGEDRDMLRWMEAWLMVLGTVIDLRAGIEAT